MCKEHNLIHSGFKEASSCLLPSYNQDIHIQPSSAMDAVSSQEMSTWELAYAKCVLPDFDLI